MSENYEEYCLICHRSDSIAGKLFHLPNNINICTDCMHKTMDTMSDPAYASAFKAFTGMNMPEDFMNPSGAFNDLAGVNKSEQGNPFENIEDGDEKTTEDEDVESENEKGPSNPKGGMPHIQFINWSDFSNLMGDNRVKKKKKSKKYAPISLDIKDIPKPHKIKEALDEYVIGQDQAKKVISVAVYNHYKRIIMDSLKNDKKKDEKAEDAEIKEVLLNIPEETEIEKSNMLLIGPTGCGKTYLVKTLAKLLNVPLAIADATTLTEAGYIGDDIESVVSKLLMEADNDVERAETGIIFIDEVDKLAKKSNEHSRDINGESVQKGMLKLLEGSDVEVPVGASSKNAMVPMTTVNTRNILFICGGAFPDLEDIIKQRLSKQTSIGFNAELKADLDKDKDTLSKVCVEDLKKFGFIPEFIGRLPIIATLQGLDENMLKSILKEPKNAILKQYEKLLELDEVKLEFEEEALLAIAKKALEKETGARALRAILEEYMLDIMYEIPKDDNIGKVTITKDYIDRKGGPLITMRGAENLNNLGEKILIAEND